MRLFDFVPFGLDFARDWVLGFFVGHVGFFLGLGDWIIRTKDSAGHLQPPGVGLRPQKARVH